VTKPYDKIGNKLYQLHPGAWEQIIDAARQLSIQKRDEHKRERDMAFASCREAIACDPQSGSAWVDMGALHYGSKDLKNARICFETATSVDPDYSLAWFDLANVLEEIGQVQESKRCYLSAIAVSPQYADAHFNLGLVYEKLGENRAAIKHYELYLKHTGDADLHRTVIQGRIKALRAKDLRCVPKPAVSSTVNESRSAKVT